MAQDIMAHGQNGTVIMSLGHKGTVTKMAQKWHGKNGTCAKNGTKMARTKWHNK